MNPISLLRKSLLQILAIIFTSSISLLYFLFRLISFLPWPVSSHIYQDLKYNMKCCTDQPKLSNTIHLIMNCTLSLLSALMISNYCRYMIGAVQWTSHQTHVVFLSLVFPKIPQMTTFTPSSIVIVYLLMGYLGLTAQISLTLDLLYIYNLPAILIYKILTISYSKLLQAIRICTQVIKYDSKNWITCQYSFITKYHNISKAVGYGCLVFMIQILFIVWFYYMWLVLVIITLLCFMNILRNAISVVRALSSILLALKGYQSNLSIGKGKRSRIALLRNLQVDWIPLIKLQDIKKIFIGKDIIETTLPNIIKDYKKGFNPFYVYQCVINP